MQVSGYAKSCVKYIMDVGIKVHGLKEWKETPLINNSYFNTLAIRMATMPCDN